MIKIEKGILMKARECRGRSVMKYPWKELEIGDSFLVPFSDTIDQRKHAQQISAQANVSGYRYNMKFQTRKRPEEGGIRVWRIA